MKHRTILALVFSAPLAIIATQTLAGPAEDKAAYQAKVKRAEALFKERCATVAGEKIYKTVDSVEGVLLMKIRPERSDREWSNPMWPGAAFAKEIPGNGYVMSFLPYREPYVGYRWVEVVDEKDGKRYRYSGRWDEPWQHDKSYLKGYIKFSLDKSLAPKDTPRYGVTYEDHVIPEERDLWVASGTLKVIDLKTKEVLGELTRYAINYVHTPSAINPAPWLTSTICPTVNGDHTKTTRIFVHQILIPAKEQ